MERHFITLLVKLGVVASLASFLVRFPALRVLLMREVRTLNQRLQLAMWFSGVFGAGVAIRVIIRGYEAVDLGLEGSLLAGVIGGYATGLVSGILISIPAMFNHEYLSLPVFAGLGVMGGLLRDCAVDKEDVWRFSPFFDLNLYRAFRYVKNLPRALFHVFFFGAILFAEFLRQTLGDIFPGTIFSLEDAWKNLNLPNSLAVYASTFLAVTLPLKVWNNARNEIKLEEQERLLMRARLDALTSQINPHFLFNTLNSVSSLIRTNPPQAREVVLQLSRILRRLLRNHENLTALRNELDFIADYLSIELVRFGEKLRYERDVAPDTLDMLVPSMLLQPLVENCVKHGLSGKMEGGTIRIEARRIEGRLQVVVQDDGVGIPEAQLATLMERGIGVNNVSERLKVLYGGDFRMYIDSHVGRGTRIAIEVPELQPSMAAVS